MSELEPAIEVRIDGAALPIDAELAEALARAVLAAEGRPELGLSVSFVDDAAIAELHGAWLDDPSPTDVISFPLLDDEDPDGILGEVVVSLETALRQAPENGRSPRDEALLYLVHGMLHLLGYDDQQPADRARMHARQDDLLDTFLGAL